MTGATSEYDLLALDVQRAFEALLPRYINQPHSNLGTKMKDDGTEVGDLDNESLAVMRALISAHFPNDYTIGEEDQLSEEAIQQLLARKDETQWAIDGLDGTGNFTMGLNSYGGMLVRRRGDQILFSAHFRPVDEKLRANGFMYAERGEGAWQWCGRCGEFHQLHTAKPGELKRMVVMIEGSSKKFYDGPIAALGKKITTRASFSSCIASSTVAMGKASAFVTKGNKPWDNWPGMLLIQEAGGVITDPYGDTVTPDNCDSIVAAANLEDSTTILKALHLTQQSTHRRDT